MHHNGSALDHRGNLPKSRSGNWSWIGLRERIGFAPRNSAWQRWTQTTRRLTHLRIHAPWADSCMDKLQGDSSTIRYPSFSFVSLSLPLSPSLSLLPPLCLPSASLSLCLPCLPLTPSSPCLPVGSSEPRGFQPWTKISGPRPRESFS
jgi:hypothetical protein